MRYLFGSVWVCLLGVPSLAGCSESGAGASGPPTVSCEGHLCPCTEAGIRAAIDAGGADAYTFACDGQQTVYTKDTIVIDSHVILDGEGKLIVDGDGGSLVFIVDPAFTAELRGFTVTGGDTSPKQAFSEAHGGGIKNHGTLMLTDSTVVGNSATDGGGILNLSEGTLTLTNCTVSDNVGTGGPGGGAGGISNWGTMTLTDSTVVGNSGTDGGGILNVGTMTVTNSTVLGNTGQAAGGILIRYFEGMDPTAIVTDSIVSGNDLGILNEGTLTLTNTTVSGNTGGGIVNGTVENGAVDSEGKGAAGTLTLANSTVSGNGGGGIANLIGMLTATNSTVSGNEGPGIRNAATAALTSSTVSGNAEEGIVTVGEGAETMLRQSLIDDECGGDDGIISNGYNIGNPGSTCGLEVVIDDLKLGALADNGGPTKTHALEPGSPAINQIPQEDCVDADGAPLATDQRGQPRPETGGSMCDVGSFEVQ